MDRGNDPKRAAGFADVAETGLAPAARPAEAPGGDAPAPGDVTTADLRKVRWGSVQALLAGAMHPRVSDALSRQLSGMLDEKMAELVTGGGRPLVMIEAARPASGGAVSQGQGAARNGDR